MTQRNLKTGKTRPVQCKRAHRASGAGAVLDAPGSYPTLQPPVPSAPPADV